MSLNPDRPELSRMEPARRQDFEALENSPELGGEAAARHMLAMMEHPERRIRNRAVEGFTKYLAAQIGGEQGDLAEVVIRGLTSDDWRVRAFTVQALQSVTETGTVEEVGTAREDVIPLLGEIIDSPLPELRVRRYHTQARAGAIRVLARLDPSSPETIERISRQLNGGQKMARYAAARVVGELKYEGEEGERMRETIKERIRWRMIDPNEDSSVRRAMITALGKMRAIEVIPLLQVMFENNYPELRTAIVEAVGEMVRRTGERGEDREVRRLRGKGLEWLLAMARRGDLTASGRVTSFASISIDERIEAAKALGNIGDPATIEALMEILYQPRAYIPEVGVELSAAVIKTAQLIDMDTLEIVEMFRPIVFGTVVDEGFVMDPDLTRKVIEHLGELQRPELAEFLLEVLDQIKDLHCAETLIALGKTRNTVVVPVLIEYIRERIETLGWGEAGAAVESLGKLGGEEAVALLVELVEMRRHTGSLLDPAIRALGEIGEVRAVPVLGRVLDPAYTFDSGWETRLVAVEALGKIGGEKAEEILQEAAGRDGSKRVRRAAEEELQKLGGEYV